MTRLILLRHGAVAAPWPDLIYGRLEVPLAPAGEEEARRVASGLSGRPLDAVIYSGLSRSAFTARLLADERGLEPVRDKRFLELDRGPWAGRRRAELAVEEPAAWGRHLESGGLYCPGGAEGPEALMARVREGLDGAAARSRGGEVAVVAHMWVLRAAVALVLGLPGSELARLAIPTSGLVAMDWGRRGGVSTLYSLAPDRP